MATTSGYAGTATTAAYGTHDWNDPAEVVGAPDATSADVTLPNSFGVVLNASSYFLVLGSFGLAADAGSLADAVTVVVKARALHDLGIDTYLYAELYLPDGTVSSFVTMPVSSGGALANFTFGGDTFGLARSQLPDTVVNDNAFRVRIWAENTASAIVCNTSMVVDSVNLSVEFSVIPDVATPPYADDDEEIRLLMRRPQRRYFV